MSHIPNSAMPHAGPNVSSSNSTNEQASGGAMSGVKARAGKIADTARENPKTAIAAGVALAAGVVAAAAIPLMRSRTETDDKSTGSKKTTEKA